VKTPPTEKKSFDPADPAPVEPPREAAEFAARHVYGRSASVCFNASVTRHGDRTVTIDVAAARPDGGYNWHEKTQFQCSPGELAELTAALFHPGLALRLVHHSSAVKTLSVTYQAPNTLISLSQGPHVLRVPIRPPDQFLVRNFLLMRLAEAQRLPPAVILRSLEVLAAQLRATDEG
jgi:hypothetical protein